MKLYIFITQFIGSYIYSQSFDSGNNDNPRILASPEHLIRHQTMPSTFMPTTGYFSVVPSAPVMDSEISVTTWPVIGSKFQSSLEDEQIRNS